MYEMLEDAYQPAVLLLKQCYRSIDAEYRSKYRMDIWKQVESKCKMAANTSPTLTRWVQAFLTFPHTEIVSPSAVAQLLGTTPPRAVLRIYREEPTVVVAFVRAEVEAERAVYEEAKQ